MKEKEPPGFKFSADGEEPDELFEEEMADLRVEKLSHRLTLVIILLPCLLAVAVYFGYRDLTGRVSRTQDTGSLEIQQLSRQIETLSKEFNDKLINFSTTLSSRDKDLVTTMSTKLSSINKTVKSLKSDLQKTRSSLKNLEAQKADKKSQDAAVAKIEAELKPLIRGVKNLSDMRADMKAARTEIDKLSLELAALAEADKQFRMDINDVNSSVSVLSGQKIDRDLLALELLKLKKQWQLLLSKVQDDLTRRMDAIQKQIEGINKTSRLHKQSMKSATKKSSVRPSTAAKTAGSDSAGIVEQDIIE